MDDNSGANTTGNATRKPTLVAVVKSSATLQVRYASAMQSAAGIQAPIRAPFSWRTMRGPKKIANTSAAKPNLMARHHMGVMLSYAIFVIALPDPKITVCSTTHAT